MACRAQTIYNAINMRAVIQRVEQASVAIAGQMHAQIAQGLLVLLGVEHDDNEADADWLAAKIAAMRIFSDEQGKMNKSVVDSAGELLVVSQFTLHASTRKGNRPSFMRAARPQQAEALYNYFLSRMQTLLGQKVSSGVFAAEMKINLINDGPVTIIVDSKQPE